MPAWAQWIVLLVAAPAFLAAMFHGDDTRALRQSRESVLVVAVIILGIVAAVILG